MNVFESHVLAQFFSVLSSKGHGTATSAAQILTGTGMVRRIAHHLSAGTGSPIPPSVRMKTWRVDPAASTSIMVKTSSSGGASSVPPLIWVSASICARIVWAVAGESITVSGRSTTATLANCTSATATVPSAGSAWMQSLMDSFSKANSFATMLPDPS